MNNFRMQQIHIGIDGNEANVTQRVGINEYAYQILWGLWEAQKHSKAPIVIEVFLKNDPLKTLPPETEIFRYRVLKGRGLWIITRLMPYLFKAAKRLNVFFSPSHYAPIFSPIPVVCSIMDLGYLEFSGQFRKKDFWQLKYWSARSMTISNRIITISESSKRDIVRHYPKFSSKIEVTYLGFEKPKTKLSKSESLKRIKSRYPIKDNYILYLGTLKPSKNVLGLVKAWSQIVNNFPEFSLVIGGKKGWLYSEIFAEIEKLGLKDSVIFTDFIPEEDKAALINGASVFVIPSFWEGFGIDVLTAMSLKVPVVASNAGSLPEVVGDAGIIIDPYNIDTIADGITKVLTMSKKEYNSLVMKGIRQSEKFFWDKTVKETLDILIEVAYARQTRK